MSSLSVFAFATGCGGGGGGSSSSALEVQATGSVAVLVADGPADAYERILLRIHEVSLLPEGRGPVTLLESEEGIEVDLLDLRDEDLLLTVRDGVPAGTYEKLRLRVSDVRSEGGPCERLELRLPSGRVDLNPRGSFDVVPGETLAVRLDIDADKSIHLHGAGRSGQCIFRPVVFVDIESLEGEPADGRCPRIVRGRVARLIHEGGAVVGFLLRLGRGRGEIEVRLGDPAAIFDEAGLPAGPEVLAEGQEVRGRGRLQAGGRLEASLVVVGDVLSVEGVAGGGVEGGRFLLVPGAGEEVSGSVEVEIAPETLLLAGCDRPAGVEAIQAGVEVMVLGKLDLEGAVFRAVAVIIGDLEVREEIVALRERDGGLELVIRPAGEGGDTVRSLFLGDPGRLVLEGDGAIPADRLEAAVACRPRPARVILDAARPGEALAVFVSAEAVEGDLSGAGGSVLVVGGRSVEVLPGATVVDARDDRGELVSLDALRDGDRLRAFGLEACPGDTVEFWALVLILVDR